MEQALVGLSDEVKLQRVLRYVLHSHHQEVGKVVDAANGSWARFRDIMQRKYRLGDGLLTMADLEVMNKDDFSTIGAFVHEFKRKVWKVHGISEQTQCAIFFGLLIGSEGSELTGHRGGNEKLTWATIDKGVEEGSLDQVEQHQVRLQSRKRKERDATASGTPGVKRIVTDVLTALGYDNEAEIQKRGVIVAQRRASGAVEEEARREDYGGEETGSQILTKAQRKQRNLQVGGQGSGKGQVPQAVAAPPPTATTTSATVGPSCGRGNQEGGQGYGRPRFDWRNATCWHCGDVVHTVRFCERRREDELSGLISSCMDGDIYDKWGEHIDPRTPGGIRQEALQRAATGPTAPSAMFRMWQEKEEPTVRVEEIVGDNEVNQRLKAGAIREEPIVVESDDEGQEGEGEPTTLLLGRMEDLLEKVGRYQRKLQALQEPSQAPPRKEPELERRKEVVEVPEEEDNDEEDERLRQEEDQRAELRAKKRGAREEAELSLPDSVPKRKKYAVWMEEGFDVERMVDKLLEGHNDLMNVKDILASAPRLRGELKGRLSRRLVPNVHLSTVLPREVKWTEAGIRMDWKCVACGQVDLVIKNQKCTGMVDTGAEMNIIKEKEAVMIGMEIDRSDHDMLHGANCKAAFCGTASNVIIEIGKVRARTCFFAMPDVDHPILLGRSFLCRTEMLIFNKHDGTMILLLCDPACGNYKVVTCRNTGPGNGRNRLNLGSFTFEESENERRRLWEVPEEEDKAEVLTLSLTDVNKAMEVVSAHDMADLEAIKALREQVLENPQQGSQRRYKTIDKKCRPVPVLVKEDEEAYYERERGLIRRMREHALAGPGRINDENEGKLIIGKSDFLSSQERALIMGLMKKRHRAYAFDDDESGRLDVDRIPMIRIHTVPHEPWNLRGTRYPNPDEEKMVVDYLDGKMQTHVADYSSGSYASPWFCFIKSNGTLRWVQDLQRLNAVTVRDAGGLSNTDALSESCAGRPIISLIDLYSGYDQFPVYPPDRPVTTMHTPRGLIHMNVAPQGWTNAVAMVQRHMIRAMQTVNPHITQPYIDDLAVKGPKEKEEDEVMPGVRRFVWKHVQDIDQVLGLLEEHNLTASGPKSKHYVRSFLGMCGFWRSFVKDFATKTEHLRKLVRQDQEWFWGEDQEEAVGRMKGEFKEGSLVLGAPNYEATEERPFVIETDAGPTALGGVLIQADTEGKERPLRFEIRTLNTTERNYSQFKKETLVGYEQKEELALKPFQEEDPWGSTDVGWMMKLALAGTDSLVEEVRTIEEGPTQVEEHEQLMGGMYLLTNTLLQGDFDRKDSFSHEENEILVPESRDDEFEEGEIKEAFRAEEYDGIYRELGLLLSCEMRDRDGSAKAQKMRHLYVVRDGHLFIKRQVGNLKRIVCGRNRQIDIIAALHDGIAGGHRGIGATCAKISELYHWDGMLTMVFKHCQSCVPCQERSAQRPGEPLHPRLEKEVGAVVHLDLLFMPAGKNGCNYIFHARDNLTGFVDGRAIRTKTGSVLANCIEEYYLRYPFVREFVMDRGSKFTCNEVRTLLAGYGVVANYTMAAHPQANAPVERGHSTITNLLAKWTEGKPGQWPKFLRAALFVENVTVKRTTKYASATLWSDFSETAMQRGGRGARPRQRPQGASGGDDSRRPVGMESTPIFDDGNIELFLDSYQAHATREGWSTLERIRHLRGVGRFEEPIAHIREEALTWQDVEARMQMLRASPMGPDGLPIRLEEGNAEEFIPAYEQYMRDQGTGQEEWMQMLPLWTRRAERSLARQIRDRAHDWEDCQA
ncbi:hypothetical protein CBR_g18765 [Chara braunii]|uniref:Integrase catalytic domain-containing protein n=1 Tax=Chara braunii TaxID=69332 RepID=A0A388KWC0_CHABU|nr:hypothetical protein CBR_g18765 [Chara braunii]|eukprot:GBG74354.1 hypothetical protein CBR_g18765 [Chara braunii]